MSAEITALNLWILTEERPKLSVIRLILNKLATDRRLPIEITTIRIQPIFENHKFAFCYSVTGVIVGNVERILLKIVSGASSFVDYLIFMCDDEPTIASSPIYAIEETKTSDIESRNTGVYQRCTKFVFVNFYYPNCKKIMLYNLEFLKEESHTDTNIFGTRMLLTNDVEIIGKTLDNQIFRRFDSIDELLDFKSRMRAAPAGNVPIQLTRYTDRITISARLFKANGLAHDPNIGATTIMALTLRTLGWTGRIVITRHGLSQQHLGARNKFIQVANKLGIELDGLSIPTSELANNYWHYEDTSQKLVTIFLHLVFLDKNRRVIYENHAGCERGYFRPPAGDPIAVHKYIRNVKSNGIIHLPDLVALDDSERQILNIEGETHSNIAQGREALRSFGDFEAEYIRQYYSTYTIVRCLVIFGGLEHSFGLPNHVDFMMYSDGAISVAENAPNLLRSAAQLAE